MSSVPVECLKSAAECRIILFTVQNCFSSSKGIYYPRKTNRILSQRVIHVPILLRLRSNKPNAYTSTHTYSGTYTSTYTGTYAGAYAGTYAGTYSSAYASASSEWVGPVDGVESLFPGVRGLWEEVQNQALSGWDMVSNSELILKAITSLPILLISSRIYGVRCSCWNVRKVRVWDLYLVSCCFGCWDRRWYCTGSSLWCFQCRLT